MFLGFTYLRDDDLFNHARFHEHAVEEAKRIHTYKPGGMKRSEDVQEACTGEYRVLRNAAEEQRDQDQKPR